MKNVSGSLIDRLRKSFDAYNVHRIFFASSILTEKKGDFFNALPVLLQYNFSFPSSIMPVELGETETPPVGIHDYTAGDMQMASFNLIFPEEEIVEASGGPSIHSLALVGSIGTVGQTDESDFDYVLFVSNRELGDAKLKALRHKLDNIEKLAMEKFDMELHFFISDWEEFRENRFGETDKENVGSALGRLFKDEFYRTAIFIAGKRPLWWLIPPGFPEKTIAEFVKEAKRRDKDFSLKYLDLGHILVADDTEFFGGAVWQMTKALDSPHKSVLKMGLLESYLFKPDAGLLCEEFKKRLLEADEMETDIDPYVMMLNRLTDYYFEQGMEKEARFLRAAFLLKSGITLREAEKLQKIEKTELSEKERRVSDLIRQWNWSEDELVALHQELTGESENRYQSLGEFERFYIMAYRRLSDWLKKSGKRHLISGEDLTVLGRKLFVRFNDPRNDKEFGVDTVSMDDKERRGVRVRRGEKIPYIHASNALEEPLKECTLAFEKMHDGKKAWMLFDFILTGATIEEMRNFKPHVCYFRMLSQMLGWIVINKVWSLGTKLNFERGMTNYIARDISKILEELQKFFIAGKKYVPQREDYLDTERVVKAFVIPNFGSMDSPGIVERADILSMNSWGELRCQVFSNDREAFNSVARILSEAEDRKKQFDMEVVAPPSQEDPSLADEFRNMVLKTKQSWEPDVHRRKKAKLDLA